MRWLKVGTAVGTGINAHPEFGARFAQELSEPDRTLPSGPGRNFFEGLSSQDTRGWSCSGQLKVIAVSGLMKIANDLRWMNSGPLAGPRRESRCRRCSRAAASCRGKVNPVIPEAAHHGSRPRFIGNDATITIGRAVGQLSVERECCPVIRVQPPRKHPSARET